MRKLAWCVGVPLLTVAASAQTEAPRVDEPNLSAIRILVDARSIERASVDHLVAKQGVEITVGNTVISSNEAAIVWSADKQSAEIRPTGDVLIRVTNLK
jgi:hypothetical protein